MTEVTNKPQKPCYVTLLNFSVRSLTLAPSVTN